MNNVQIYYHCTYKGSGGGFCLGQLIIGDQTSGNIKLSEEDTNQFIRNCFNYGTVRKACGILPQEPQKYFLLVKKLTAQGKTPEEPEHYSMNIALVTESRDQFRSWLTKGDDSEQEIAETVRDSMDTDDNRNDFSFTVRAEQVVALAGKSFKSLFVGCPLEDTESTTCVEKYYTKTDLKKLAEDLQLADSDKVFEKSGSGKWVVYRKKKQTLGCLSASIASAAKWLKIQIARIIEWIKKRPVFKLFLLVLLGLLALKVVIVFLFRK